MPAEPDDVARRREAAVAGHRGDERTARRLLRDPAPGVRAAALGALSRMGALDPATAAQGLHDASPVVRRRAAAESHRLDVDLRPLLADTDPLVVEAAAWALGERGERTSDDDVAALATVATGHQDPLCREAAVAALGAVGHPAGLPAVLAATTDKPAVRRRAVLALAPFSGPEVDAALQRAREDRDWQVRQAAEDLLGDSTY